MIRIHHRLSAFLYHVLKKDGSDSCLTLFSLIRGGGTTTTANGIVTTFPGDELRDIIVVKWIIVDVKY